MNTANSTIISGFLKFAGIFIVYLIALPSFGQKPTVKAIDKKTGSMSETVTIKGNTFGTNPTVFFGAAKASLLSSSDQLIEASVPPGATFSDISVTNTTLGLTGYSQQQFLLSFRGDHGFNVSNLQGQTDFDAESGLYDLALGDLDGDKKTDIVCANNNANFISILMNTSTGPGNINFSKLNIALGTKTLHIKCADLNGDGKLDIIANEGGLGIADQIFILQNTSSGIGSFTFSAPIALKFAGRKPSRIDVADMDQDGKPDILFTDQSSILINNVPITKLSILRNQSTASSISILSTPFDFIVTGAISTDGLAVGDLNGDGYPEIATSQFQTNNSQLFIITNQSSPGTFNLTNITKFSIGNTVKRIRIGDLDGDQKPDIAVTQLLGSAISVFLNKCTGAVIDFSSPVSITTYIGPWGIDFGDVDGDGKTDIVVSSIKSDIDHNKSITILNNESTVGNVSFVKKIVATTFVNRHIAIGDLDSDGKPDIAFASIDDAIEGAASKISIFRNKACMIPKITPEGPLNVCSNFLPVKLTSTISDGATYDWKNTSTSVQSSAVSTYNVLATGDYTVTAIAEGGSCSKVSNVVKVTVGASTPVANSAPSNNGPICIGGELKVSITNDIGATYQWSGPAGYSSTGVNPTPISNFTLDNAGYYYVDVVVGGCVAKRESTLVEAIDIPDFKVQYAGTQVICSGTKTLSVTPTPSGFTYQWFEKDLGNVGSGSSYIASASGEYFFKASTPGCSGIKETSSVKITIASQPAAEFTMPANACMGQDIQFTNHSTIDPATTAFYTWNFGDSQTSTDENPKHKYLSATTFNVKLTVSYADGACSITTPTQPIVIQSAPIATITNPDNKYEFCEGETLKLQVLGTYNTYKWSTGEETQSILVDHGGTYTVDVTTASCTLNAERSIDMLETNVVVSADPAEINENQTSQLTASGLDNYPWTPTETLTDPSIANPVASPVVTTTYTVTGTTQNGCTGTGTVILKVIGEPVVNKLKPGNFFSPNGKGTAASESWFVEKIQDYPQCNVAIYDEKGIKVFEAKPYNNDWDGTFHGRKLPDGVYYFIIRCEGEENKPRSGSITLLR